MSEPDALPPDLDPYDAYWRPVTVAPPHRWIALTTDWRVADRLSRQHCIILGGWPVVAAADWLQGPYAAEWWLPCFGRRVMLTAWTDADAHLATLVMPVIERMRPARLLYRSYRAVSVTVTETPNEAGEGGESHAGTPSRDDAASYTAAAPSANETGHAAAA